jgi:hypothetical protein
MDQEEAKWQGLSGFLAGQGSHQGRSAGGAFGADGRRPRFLDLRFDDSVTDFIIHNRGVVRRDCQVYLWRIGQQRKSSRQPGYSYGG